jgi:hypothetical protein
MHTQLERTLRSACAVQVWCPSEEGEWKGLSKGRAVRSMQFKVKLQRDIRKRNKHLKVSHSLGERKKANELTGHTSCTHGSDWGRS